MGGFLQIIIDILGLKGKQIAFIKPLHGVHKWKSISNILKMTF